MKCPYCGTENLEDAKECTACKASLETPEVIEEDSDSNITLTLGNAQAQMQEAPKLTAKAKADNLFFISIPPSVLILSSFKPHFYRGIHYF